MYSCKKKTFFIFFSKLLVFPELVTYNESNKDIGGKASVQRFHTTEGECDQPLILAICTPLMSRVHQHIQQAGELVFIDSSSSFDDYDYNNNIITNDSQAERIGLRRTWPNASMYLCVFHFLQTMWRWLLIAVIKSLYNIDNT